jgi:hypothetical protein
MAVASRSVFARPLRVSSALRPTPNTKSKSIDHLSRSDAQNSGEWYGSLSGRRICRGDVRRHLRLIAGWIGTSILLAEVSEQELVVPCPLRAIDAASGGGDKMGIAFVEGSVFQKQEDVRLNPETQVAYRAKAGVARRIGRGLPTGAKRRRPKAGLHKRSAEDSGSPLATLVFLIRVAARRSIGEGVAGGNAPKRWVSKQSRAREKQREPKGRQSLPSEAFVVSKNSTGGAASKRSCACRKKSGASKAPVTSLPSCGASFPMPKPCWLRRKTRLLKFSEKSHALKSGSNRMKL